MNKSTQSEWENQVRQRLELLRETAPRSPEAISQGREAYMRAVRSLAETSTKAAQISSAPVSFTLFQRLSRWMKETSPTPLLKERKIMFSTLTTLLVTITLLFGGAGATVYAAQASGPADFLYPVKTLGEDARLGLTSNTQNQLNLALEYTNRRVGEILDAVSDGEPIPEEAVLRYQEQLRIALNFASGMDDREMEQSLLHLRDQIQKQDRIMEKLQTQVPDQAEPLMVQMRDMIRSQLRLVESGLENPAAFRQQLREQEQLQAGENTQPGEPGAPGNDAAGGPDYEGAGPGPANSGELTQPDEGYGPGPGPMGGEESNGYGPGPANQGEENNDGPGPVEDEDGNSYGPGPGNTGDTTQPDEGYGPGEPMQGGSGGQAGETGSGDGTDPVNMGEVTQPAEGYAPGPATPSPQPGMNGPGPGNQGR
ncbi:MAG: DUF5667 domain-containing protein [Anaerolineales bacterium]